MSNLARRAADRPEPVAWTYYSACATCGHDARDNDGETHTSNGSEGACRLCDSDEPCGLYR